MTRHSKNATAGPTYTAHEKKKDSKQSGYGTQDVRLSKDSIKVFLATYLFLLFNIFIF
jgi:nitric oxide synthase-interacting protein